MIYVVLGALLALLASCGGKQPPPPVIRMPTACPLPPGKACLHAKRLPIPPKPLMTGFPDIDEIRLDEYARKVELWASMDWRACNQEDPRW